MAIRDGDALEDAVEMVDRHRRRRTCTAPADKGKDVADANLLCPD